MLFWKINYCKKQIKINMYNSPKLAEVSFFICETILAR